jgi:hypothetical protein
MSVFELKLVLFHFWGKSAGGFVRRVNIPHQRDGKISMVARVPGTFGSVD